MNDTEPDHYPYTWEIPALVAALLGLVLVGAIHLGRALANLAGGAGWRWTPSTNLLTSVPGILHGDATAGLADVHPVATPTQLYLSVFLCISVAVVLTVVALLRANQRWGSGRVRGTATTHQAREVLGVQRLHRHRRIIRPDLYPSRHR